MTASIVDVSSACGDKGGVLYAAGVRTVIRYYSRDTIRPSKRLSVPEARALAKAGLRLGIVHEGRYGDRADNFDRDSGEADARYARTYGATQIGQPAGSAIYFGVDFDATAAEIRNRVVPYFEGVKNAFSAVTGEAEYRIGVYGSGATCKAILDADLATFAWVAQSRGWSGYAAFVKSKRWALLQGMPVTIGGIDCDPNDAAADQRFGDFEMPQEAPGASVATPMKVNARAGLHLRAGPGTEFESAELLPLGTLVYPMKTVDSWRLVDLQGDGIADGFVSGAYLTDITSSAPGNSNWRDALLAATRTDASHVAELVRQGGSADGLRRARTTAAAALTGYPTNGCAAHLSALLQQAGINVPMTFGAGMLARVLAKRGWSEVPVGQQIPGDIGVCWDNNPNPPGADHIYLVVGTIGTDEMMVADNQRKTNSPHTRFASGRGKTPTEYFLRAL